MALVYSVALAGFSKFEQDTLAMIFKLAERRTPAYHLMKGADATQSADLIIADADDAAMFAAMRASIKPSQRALLVGALDHGTGWPLLSRPINWSKMLKAMDDIVAGLPKVQVVAAPVATPAAPLSPTVAAAVVASAASAHANAPDRVLVVDDSDIVLKFMAAKLAPYGFEVDYAKSGEEAIGMTANKAYHCIFLDVVMGGVDGYQVCKMIKQRKYPGKAPTVVMLTGKGSPFDKIRGTMAGCDAYLTKPVDEERLLAVIGKFLNTTNASTVSASQVPGFTQSRFGAFKQH